MPDQRDRLVRRIVVEARAAANADDRVRSQVYGRVLGLLDAGVVLGFWTKRRADGVAELVRHRYRLDRIPSMLLRDEAVALWTTSDVAEFLGLSRSRVDVPVHEGRMPRPKSTGCHRLWERSTIERWADAEWWDSRRWRNRST